MKPKDVLISLVGTIGKTLVLPEDVEPGIINPRLVKISFDYMKTNPFFFKYYLESNSVRHYFSIVAHGGTMDILNLAIPRELPIPLPTLFEQNEIMKKIDDLFSLYENINNNIERNIRFAKNLYLHGIGSDESPIVVGDALISDPGEKFDFVLTNPPFGKKAVSLFSMVIIVTGI